MKTTRMRRKRCNAAFCFASNGGGPVSCTDFSASRWMKMMRRKRCRSSPASQVMVAVSVVHQFFSFEEDEDDVLLHIHVLENKVTMIAFKEKRKKMITIFFLSINIEL